jgi:hypothetical protein
LGPKSWLFGSYSDGLWLTEDSGTTWQNVTADGASGCTAGKNLILPLSPNPADSRYYLPSMEGILQSTGADGKGWSLIPNSGGRAVGFVIGDDHMYSSDQWSVSMSVASNDAPAVWTKFSPASEWGDHGSPYLAYDSAHHVLYASKWPNGLWRVVTP